MTRRDLGWRALGLAFYVAGIACAFTASPNSAQIGSAMVIDGLLLSILGLVLMVKGRRLALALRIEKGRHRNLPDAIHRFRVHRRPR